MFRNRAKALSAAALAAVLSAGALAATSSPATTYALWQDSVTVELPSVTVSTPEIPLPPPVTSCNPNTIHVVRADGRDYLEFVCIIPGLAGDPSLPENNRGGLEFKLNWSLWYGGTIGNDEDALILNREVTDGITLPNGNAETLLRVPFPFGELPTTTGNYAVRFADIELRFPANSDIPASEWSDGITITREWLQIVFPSTLEGQVGGNVIVNDVVDIPESIAPEPSQPSEPGVETPEVEAPVVPIEPICPVPDGEGSEGNDVVDVPDVVLPPETADVDEADDSVTNAQNDENASELNDDIAVLANEE